MGLRTVEYNIYRIAEYSTVDGTKKLVEGTGTISKDYPEKGLFHTFLQEGEEGEMNAVAVIEKEDGTVDTVLAYRIRFTDKPPTLLTQLHDEQEK
jgi:hypothetical protein